MTTYPIAPVAVKRAVKILKTVLCSQNCKVGVYTGNHFLQIIYCNCKLLLQIIYCKMTGDGYNKPRHYHARSFFLQKMASVA